MKKKKWNKKAHSFQYLSHNINLVILVLTGLLVSIPPLFFIEHDRGTLMEGFQSIMIINAELKFSVVLIFAPLICGIILINLYFKGKTVRIDKTILLGVTIFLIAIIFSSIFAHNFQRAWNASLQLYLIPLLLVFCFLHISLDRKRITTLLGMIVLSGSVSCFITLDQHYLWTEWSQKFPRASGNLAGIIYNQNFAAEYHLLIIPPTVALIYLVQSRLLKLILISVVLLILMPAITISLARGAWIGLIGGCLIASILFLCILWIGRSKISREIMGYSLMICFSFGLLSILLPIYIQFSEIWKKGGLFYEFLTNINLIFIPLIFFLIWNILRFTKNHLTIGKLRKYKTQIVFIAGPLVLIFLTISLQNYISQKEGSRELNELKSIVNKGSQWRLDVWEDALKECLRNDTLWGKGSNHYEVHYNESAKKSAKHNESMIIRYTHNDFLQIFFENGIMGLLSFVFLWGSVLYFGLMSAFKHAEHKSYGFVAVHLALLASSIGFLITMFFEFPSRMPSSMIVAWILFGLSLALSLKYKEQEKSPFALNPFFKFIIGAIGITIIPYGFSLAYDNFWGNLFYHQARMSTKLGDFEQALKFDKESTSHTPWTDRSRKWECFLLMSQKKDYEKALNAANNAISIHPGSLNSHQYKISLLLNKLGRKKEAKIAFEQMKKIAPYHNYTKKESEKFP